MRTKKNKKKNKQTKKKKTFKTVFVTGKLKNKYANWISKDNWRRKKKMNITQFIALNEICSLPRGRHEKEKICREGVGNILFDVW